MSKRESETLGAFAAVIGELLRGKRYSRQTLAASTGKSLGTVDRWLAIIAELPTAEERKEGRTTWVTLRGVQPPPTQQAVVGACIASSLAGLFEGTELDRNLRDGRDQMLRARGADYGDLDRKFVFAPRGGEYALPENSAALDQIVEALFQNRRLRFEYKHNNGQRDSLLVEPLSLIVFDHQFYVMCRRDEGDWYCYRFARMAAVDATTQTFEYPPKSQFDPRRVLEPVFGVHVSGDAPVERVVVELVGGWAAFATGHKWHHSQEVEPVATGRVRVKLRVRLCPEVETWVLGFGEFARVLEPVQLRDKVAARVAKMAQRPEPPQESAKGPSVSRAKQHVKGVAPARAGSKQKRVERPAGGK